MARDDNERDATSKYDVNDLVAKKEQAKKSRRYYERDWLLNLAFLQGEHYVEWAPASGRLVDTAAEEGAVRSQRNVMFKIARIERAKLMRVPLTPLALPQSEDSHDVMDAKMMNAYYRWLSHEWKFPRKLRTAYFWVVATGNAILKWYWDQNGNQCAVIPPLDFFPDPYAKSMQDIRWAIHQQFMDEDAAKAMFKGVKKADMDAIVPSAFSDVSASESAIYTAYRDGYSTLPGVVMNEYWEPPSPAVPKGKHVLFTTSGVVFSEDFPYDHGKMPFTHMGHVEMANTKWYSSVLTQIRPMQEEVNRTESQLIENRNMANGKWFLASDLELAEMPNAKPRQILVGKGNPVAQPPLLITPQPLPAEVWMEPQRLVAAMEDIAGQHEVSQGGVPGRVESGQAIQLLQETEDSVVKDVIMSSEEAVAEGFWMAGALYKQYGDDATMLNVYDAAGQVEVSQLKKDKINLSMRVVTQSATALPFSTAGKWDRVLNLVQNEMVDKVTGLKLIGLTPENPDLDPAEKDRRAANRENLLMIESKHDAEGRLTTPAIRAHIYDNHGAHREEHDSFRKGAEYIAAVREDPRIEQVFAFHDEEHRKLDIQVAVEQAEKQLAVQNVLAPAPPAAPPGSEPGSSAASPVAPPPPAPEGPPIPQGV
jgi:hypothetical protein